MRVVRSSGLVLVAALVAAACGGGGGDGGSGGGDAIGSVDDVQSATVQIVARGTFVDPEFGLQADAAGSGSGFIIDPSGIAVTNNHVVTGAATLEVFVGGSDDAVNATILGVSECSDLAVIDIEGDGFPYLDWFTGDVRTNLEVWSAGFPLGDPEFTLTRGIVSKAAADGETDWASVDGVIEHDARINPGNSGGPLVDESARVVGVNYAGRSDTDQNFAITAAEARGIVEQLRAGTDVWSIGVNGQAVVGEAGDSGIWVASVETGSPAEEAGIRAGDVILRLENLTLAVDGTMAEYCDILRSRQPSDQMAVEVLRFDTQELLTGELNGDELEVAFSFGQDIEDDIEDTGTIYARYVTVTDDSGVLEIEVPAEWSDVDGTPIDRGPNVSAATDLRSFFDEWTEPGVSFTATRDLVPVATRLDQLTVGSCTSQGREDYDDGAYQGTFEFFSDCAGTDTGYVTIVARPPSGAYQVEVIAQLVSSADLDALEHIIASFQVVDESF